MSQQKRFTSEQVSDIIRKRISKLNDRVAELETENEIMRKIIEILEER